MLWDKYIFFYHKSQITCCHVYVKKRRSGRGGYRDIVVVSLSHSFWTHVGVSHAYTCKRVVYCCVLGLRCRSHKPAPRTNSRVSARDGHNGRFLLILLKSESYSHLVIHLHVSVTEVNFKAELKGHTFGTLSVQDGGSCRCSSAQFSVADCVNLTVLLANWANMRANLSISLYWLEMMCSLEKELWGWRKQSEARGASSFQPGSVEERALSFHAVALESSM